MIRQGLERLARLARFAPALLEARCPGCGAVRRDPAGDSALCPACLAELSGPDAQACPGCGEPAPVSPALPEPCAACQGSPRPWGRLLAFGPYDGRLRELILAYKFEARLDLGRQLQECLLAAFTRGLAAHPELGACEFLVPVPLHARRLFWRGFNQSRELARLVASRQGLPLVQEALVRVRRTVPQMELTRSERAGNIRGAFAARPDILAGRTALLVDDIMTTGSTLEECTRMMLAAGARAVHVLVLARS